MRGPAKSSGAKVRARGARRGFTLIETALATVIVGTGVLAIVAAQQAFFKQNEWSTHASTAQRLGNEIRELTMHLSRHDPVTGTAFWGPEPEELEVSDFDDLDDFDGEDGAGTVFSAALGNGPLSAVGAPIPGMAGWSQRVFVEHVDAFELTRVVADGASEMVRIQVVVEYQGPGDEAPREITRVSWIAPG
jgi:prepilin-type N-terminal cleavage/methylation domain-containing protein